MIETITRHRCDRCGRIIEGLDATAEPLQDLDCRGAGFEPVRYDDLCEPCRGTIGRLVAKMRRGKA